MGGGRWRGVRSLELRCSGVEGWVPVVATAASAAINSRRGGGRGEEEKNEERVVPLDGSSGCQQAREGGLLRQLPTAPLVALQGYCCTTTREMGVDRSRNGAPSERSILKPGLLRRNEEILHSTRGGGCICTGMKHELPAMLYRYTLE